MKHKYLLFFFIAIHITSEMAVKDIVTKKIKTALGGVLEGLSKSISGKALEYSFHQPLYDPGISQEQKKEIESIFKDYISVYSISLTPETYKATTEKISNILKITQNNLDAIPLKTKGEDKQDASFLSAVDLTQNHVIETINFWLNNHVFEKFKDAPNYEDIKKKNTITSTVLSQFKNNYINLKTILEEYCYNNIISIALQKESVPEKLLLNKTDENNFQVTLDELIASKTNIKNIIEGNLSYNKTIQEILSLLELDEKETNQKIKENEEKKKHLNQEIEKVKEHQNSLKKKKEDESKTYEREIAIHEMNFDVTHYAEKITNKKNLLDQKEKELGAIQNSGGWNFLKNKITFSENGKKKEIEDIKKDIEFLKKSREETLEQKQREYALFMPEEHAKKMKQYDQNIEEINFKIEEITEEIKIIDKTEAEIQNKIDAIKKIQKSLEPISQTIAKAITSAENKIFTYINAIEKDKQKSLFSTMQDFLKKEKKEATLLSLSSEIKTIQENKQTLDKSVQKTLQTAIGKIHNLNNLLMNENKTIYLLLLLFIEEPLTAARNQNTNRTVNLGSDFFFACIQIIDTLENEGTIFADAEFLKVASHIHQKINDLQAMISSTVSFLSTFIILHSFNPHAKKEPLAFLTKVPLINEVANFFNKESNTTQDKYGFVQKSPLKESTNQKLPPQKKERGNTGEIINTTKNFNDIEGRKINASYSDTSITTPQEKNTPETVSQNKLSTKIKNTVFAFFTNNPVYQYLINLIFRF